MQRLIFEPASREHRGSFRLQQRERKMTTRSSFCPKPHDSRNHVVRRVVRTAVITLSIAFCNSTFAQPADVSAESERDKVVEQLMKRVEELESRLKELDAQPDRTSQGGAVIEEVGGDPSDAAGFLDLGGTQSSYMPEIWGWFGIAYTDDDRPGTKATIDAHPLYVSLSGEPIQNIRYLAEIEAEHVFQIKGSGTKGELKLERLYMEYEFMDSHRIRGGKFFTPFGYWYQLHWHFLTETLSRPISFNNQYVPRHNVGAQYLGRSFLGDKTSLEYNLWFGDGPDVFGTDKRTESDFSLGGSLFTTYQLNNSITLGNTIGYYQQEAAFDDQRNYVVGVKAEHARLELRAELYHHDRTTMDDLTTWYGAATAFVHPRLGLTYRLDSGDDIKLSKSTVDPRTISQSIGFVWRPYAQLLVKGEYRLNDFGPVATGNFNQWNLFTALKF